MNKQNMYYGHQVYIKRVFVLYGNYEYNLVGLDHWCQVWGFMVTRSSHFHINILSEHCGWRLGILMTKSYTEINTAQNTAAYLLHLFPSSLFFFL